MAITYVSAVAAAATSMTLPTHAKNDLLLMFAYANTGVPTITVPAGWIPLESAIASSGRTGLIAAATATSASVASGTWTNATHILCAVYRSDASKFLFPGFSATSAPGTTTTISYIAIAAANKVTSNSNWIVAFIGTSTDVTTGAETAPSGMINRYSLASSGEVAVHDTNADVASFSSTTVTASSNVNTRIYTLEIIETDIAIPAGGVRQVNIRGGADQ